MRMRLFEMPPEQIECQYWRIESFGEGPVEKCLALRQM
jgi:hypothetical protein